tara:strand:- start:55 stop:237 length:183 start_codon:yes stop_codon:yes gene_type:complete
MTQEFKPTEEQLDTIARTLEFVGDELRELQQELICPDSYIAHLIEGILLPYTKDEKQGLS